MARLNAYIHNALAQLFDEIEEKCHVKFATFTASDAQGQKTLAAGTRDYMDDEPNNSNHGIYKYLYDPDLAFDYRFHQRLAEAPFEKTSKPWATIMFNTRQARPLTDILSHKYTDLKYDPKGNPFQLKIKRVSVPVNMAIISNDLTKLYNTTEKIAMYFDRFINFHYDHVITIGNPEKDGFEIFESKVGQAANIREVDLTKLDTETRGQLVSEAYSFDLVYFAVETPETYLKLLKRIIVEVREKGSNYLYNKFVIQDDDWEFKTPA